MNICWDRCQFFLSFSVIYRIKTWDLTVLIARTVTLHIFLFECIELYCLWMRLMFYSSFFSNICVNEVVYKISKVHSNQSYPKSRTLEAFEQKIRNVTALLITIGRIVFFSTVVSARSKRATCQFVCLSLFGKFFVLPWQSLSVDYHAALSVSSCQSAAVAAFWAAITFLYFRNSQKNCTVMATYFQMKKSCIDKILMQ